MSIPPPIAAATGIRVSCGTWYRQSKVANSAGGMSTSTALAVNSTPAPARSSQRRAAASRPASASTSPPANTGPGT